MPIAKIPFCGFYETMISEAIDDNCRYLFEDNSGNLAKQDEYEDFCIHADFSMIHDEIAHDYGDWFVDALKTQIGTEFPELAQTAERLCKEMRFHHWDSPSFYNFETDHIYIEISSEALDFLLDLSKRNLTAQYGNTVCHSFAEYVAEALRPRDGFIPHYSNDIDDWASGWNKRTSIQNGLLVEFVTYGLGMDDDSNRLDVQFIEDRAESISGACWKAYLDWKDEFDERNADTD